MTTAMEPEQNASSAKADAPMREWSIWLILLHSHNYYTLDQPTISDKAIRRALR